VFTVNLRVLGHGGTSVLTRTNYITVAAGPLAGISVVPSPVTVTVGTTQTFIASGSDAFGNPVPITPVWTSDAGTMFGNVLTAQTSPHSNRHVTATVGGMSGIALVNVVSGPLAHIDVTPSPVTVTVNATQTFAAYGTDAFNNAVAISPTWTTDAGVLSGNVLTTQALPASGRHVTATVGTISGSATVNIVPAADSVVIVSANPAPPYCVLRNSPDLFDRLLELTGQNFSTTDHNLQFRQVITGDLSLQFHMEVNWESSTRITVDMNRIKGLLWLDSKVTLNARLTNGSYQPVSDWSPDFILADDVATCGLARPRPLSSVTIDGPIAGGVQTSYIFTATVAPPTATLPITYVWQATGQSVFTRTGGLNNSTAFVWNSPGSQLITVTAMNTTNAVADVHVITITQPSPVTSFTASPTSGAKPLTVVFTDTSIGAISSRAWTFGDGGTSAAQNPVHQYTSVGLFTVTLQVNGPGGSSFLTRTNFITVTEPPPVANFTASPTNGLKPLMLVFTDTSTGTISAWAWNFGDGSNGVSQNPAHQYTTAGVFTASLQVTGPGGSSILTRTNLITVTEPPPVANFTASPTSGLNPLTVVFTDQSIGLVTNWLWRFGDGWTSTQPSPSHTYTLTGSFGITLTVIGPGGTNVLVKDNFITVTEKFRIFLPIVVRNL
jgi:PKD repeat protein